MKEQELDQIDQAVEEYNYNRHDKYATACLLYDVEDDEIWVDYLLDNGGYWGYPPSVKKLTSGNACSSEEEDITREEVCGWIDDAIQEFKEETDDS